MLGASGLLVAYTTSIKDMSDRVESQVRTTEGEWRLGAFSHFDGVATGINP